jgi:hypothetical protein
MRVQSVKKSMNETMDTMPSPVKVPGPFEARFKKRVESAREIKSLCNEPAKSHERLAREELA